MRARESRHPTYTQLPSATVATGRKLLASESVHPGTMYRHAVNTLAVESELKADSAVQQVNRGGGPPGAPLALPGAPATTANPEDLSSSRFCPSCLHARIDVDLTTPADSAVRDIASTLTKSSRRPLHRPTLTWPQPALAAGESGGERLRRPPEPAPGGSALTGSPPARAPGPRSDSGRGRQ